jgi:hypothetical protein
MIPELLKDVARALIFSMILYLPIFHIKCATDLIVVLQGEMDWPWRSNCRASIFTQSESP